MSYVIQNFSSNLGRVLTSFKFVVRFVPLVGYRDDVGDNPHYSLVRNSYKVKSVENPTIKYKPLEVYSRRGNILYLPTVLDNDKEIQLVFIDDDSLSFFKFFIWQFSLVSAKRMSNPYDGKFSVFHFNYIDKSINGVKGKFFFNMYLYFGDVKKSDERGIVFESYYHRVFEQCWFLSLSNQSLDYSNNTSVLEYSSQIYFCETYYDVSKTNILL